MKSKLFVGTGALLCGTLLSFTAQGEPPIENVRPTLTSPVVYETEFATYQDTMPFVKSVKWDHPLIKAAGVAFGFENGSQVVTVSEGATLRGSNSSSGPAVAQLPAGTKCQVVRSRTGWYQVKAAGKEGWVSVAEVAANVGTSRSAMTYGDHLRIYQLDSQNDWGRKTGLYETISGDTNLDPAEREGRLDQIDMTVARANYENFVKTLLGEFRDYPYMVEKKLKILAYHTQANVKGPQSDAPDQEYLFDSLTGEGYSRLRWIMSTVYSAREQKLNPGGSSGYNYPWGENGHVCRRTDNSVPAFTHAEMRYIFEVWLQDPKHTVAAGETLAGVADKYKVKLEDLTAHNGLAPGATLTAGQVLKLPLHRKFDLEGFEKGLQEYIAEKCGPEDTGFRYDFRGHKNWKPNEYECNAFVWISRDAAQVYLGQQNKGETPDNSYYLRPFATRYEKTKQCLGAYLLYPEEHHQHMRKASESGGGCHLYVDVEDQNGDGIADYRIFPDVMGQGDIGLESQALPADKVYAQPVTRSAISTFDAGLFAGGGDWGFFQFTAVNGSTRQALARDGVFQATDSDEQATFKFRMSRLNQALDRHTNWGPTHMFSPKAYRVNKRHAIRGAYSPIVAMSYEISKSHSFATGNYPATHPKDQGKTKWMFVMKYPADHYYDERRLKAGDPINWDDYFLNEASLSNDYYAERALDKFGWIPADDIHAAPYLAEADGEDGYYPGGGFGSPSAGWGFVDATGNPQ